jgi:pimeloyl-ACP methyl ester carboxylesterase
MNSHTALILAALTLSPGPVAFAGEAGSPLDKAPSRFAKHDDIRVHYKSLGQGETALVFVHGWTCDLTFWRAQVPALDGKMRMILIDLPGHGKSDKPKIEYTMDLFARSIDAVLQDAGVNEAVLAGHSMGTPVVRQFYRLFPKKTRGLIAVDGSLRPFPGGSEQFDKFIAMLSGPESEAMRGKMIDSMFTERTTDEVKKAIKSVMMSAPQHVAVGAFKGMRDPAIWKEDEIKVPLQVILAKSKWWAEDYEKYVRKLAPQVDYRVMEGVGHFLMLEEPGAFNEIMTAFLRKEGFVK